ncbi:DMT family transporter [Gemmatimonas groenlandica]|uniref:DMT family transporter n=1 Tax=Gemmatimonas groenlandica TaxID=2732249 RepID=A0A6M4IJV2_9BACT|nr:DMT family transporter [Gemmatimonas groenlandica]QJR34129.1 DMT family transporter [Gemmatimonas groenlandica]
MSPEQEASSSAQLLRATLLVVLSACCFGSISPLTVIAIGHGMALESVQAWRYTTSAVLLVAYGWWRGTPRRSGVAPWFTPRILLVAGGGQATIATLALLALQWLPAATVSFLFYTFPAWVAVITALRGIERLDRTRVTALVLALGGIGFMVGAPSAASLNALGVAAVLTAALVYAIYIPVLGTLQRQREAIDVSRAIAVGGAMLFATWAVVTGTLFRIPDGTAFGLSALQGVLTAISFVTFLAGLRVLGPVRTAITSTVEPFWTTMLGLVLLRQSVGTGTLIGGVAIMGAVLLLQRPPVAHRPAQSSAADT